MILNHTYVIIRAREWVIQSTQNYSCIHLDDSERHFIRHEYLLADAIAGTPTRIFTGRMWSYSLRSSMQSTMDDVGSFFYVKDILKNNVSLAYVIYITTSHGGAISGSNGRFLKKQRWNEETTGDKRRVRAA